MATPSSGKEIHYTAPTLGYVAALLVLLAAFPALFLVDYSDGSDDPSTGTTGDCAWYLSDEGTLTISGKGAMGDYSIDSPSPWGTYVKDVVIENGVTSVGDFVFYRCTSLASVSIPDSVNTIGDYAFSRCASLTSVTIGSSVITVGDFAFERCTSLIRLSIPDSVDTIGDYAFSKCTSLASVSIPDSVITMGDFAFERCTSLIRLSIPDSVTSVGRTSFFGCISLTSVSLGNSVASIGESTFRGCISLTSVYIGNSVASIEGFAFAGCSALARIALPDSVASIGDFAFRGCTSLTSVSIPDSVTSLGEFAFDECSSLTSVTIGSSVTSIGEFAFDECSSLTSIVFGSSVTTIGHHAFDGCTFRDGSGTVLPHTSSSLAGHMFHGASRESLVMAESHTPGEPVREDEVPSTCTEDGSYDSVTYCTVCHAELSRETVAVPKLGHDVVIDPAVPATHSAPGLTEGSHCARCDEVFVAQKEIPIIPATGTVTEVAGVGGEVSIDVNDVRDVSAEGLDLAAICGILTVVLPPDILAAVTDGMSGEFELVSEVITEEQLPYVQRTAAEGAALILSFDLTVGGKDFDELGGMASVSAEYEPEPEQDITHMYVVHIDDDGAAKRVDYTYEDGKVTFMTDHFSIYALMFDPAPADGGFPAMVAAIVVVIAAIAAAAAAIVVKRR